MRSNYGKSASSWIAVDRVKQLGDSLTTHFLVFVFFNLILLAGSLNQLISVPSMMIPIVSPSAPSRVETDLTVALRTIPR